MTAQRTSAAPRLVTPPNKTRHAVPRCTSMNAFCGTNVVRSPAAPRAGDLLPLDGAGGFGGDVVGDTVHAGNFVDDAA